MSTQYIVRYGLQRSLGAFSVKAQHSLARNTEVILRSDRGMTTAEYAVGTVAACGFAGVLYKLLTIDVVVTFLTEILRRAFGLLG